MPSKALITSRRPDGGRSSDPFQSSVHIVGIPKASCDVFLYFKVLTSFHSSRDCGCSMNAILSMGGPLTCLRGSGEEASSSVCIACVSATLTGEGGVCCVACIGAGIDSVVSIRMAFAHAK